MQTDTRNLLISAGVGLAMLAFAIWIARPWGDGLEGLDADEDETPAPKKRRIVTRGAAVPPVLPAATVQPAPEPEAPVAPTRALPVIPAAEPIPPGTNLMAAQSRRHAARKFYGSFVLASQSAMSMDKIAKRGGNAKVHAENVRDSMLRSAGVSLRAARQLDPGYVRMLCGRDGSPPCNFD